MKIKKIKVNNFRSVGETPLIIDDLKKFNLIIGKNNSGKSNTLKILPFINDLIQDTQNAWFQNNFVIGWRNSINDSAYINEIFYNSDESKSIALEFTIQLDLKEKTEIINGLPNLYDDYRKELLVKADEITFYFNIRKNNQNNFIYEVTRILVGTDLPLFELSTTIMRNNGGAIQVPGNFQQIFNKQSGLGAGFEYINNLQKQLFRLLVNKLNIIWTVRKVSSKSLEQQNQLTTQFFNSLGIEGTDAIDVIDTLRHPNDNHRIYLRKYRDLNKFVSDLVGEKITLIPNGNKRELNVEKESDGSVLSIKSLGSSIEELTVIATTLINYPDNSIVAIEEPEVHLDPILQRKLIRYLKQIPNISQFFFSSHSNVFINEFTSADSNIYRTSYKNDVTSIEKIEKVDNKSINIILDDLGVKASDLLQSNGIIWVEGPSERIYINKWLELKKANLIEGIHYSIMFYGGRLLSNLSVGEEVGNTEIDTEVEITTTEFIDLLKINRNIILMMDSDKQKENDNINATKKRIIDEIARLNSKTAMTWVTQGREIENYISPKLFEEMFGISDINIYTRINDKVKEKNENEGKKGGYIKLEAAKKIIELIDGTEFDQKTDLSIQLDQLIKTIKEWNTWL